jgi:hypothetical protein
VVTEYRDRPLPEVTWPAFPDPAGKVSRNADGWVIMPTSYWLDVTRYVIDTEAAIDIIEASRAER